MKIYNRQFNVRVHNLMALWLVGASSCHAAPQVEATKTEATKPEAPVEGQWKTTYFKRGFLGPYDVAAAGGIDSTIRTRVAIPFDGTRVRVYLGPVREVETIVSKISLARGKDGGAAGIIEGAPVALNFSGVPAATIPANGARIVSDVAEATITSGDWYVQQSYASKKISYAYNVDGYHFQAGDHHDATKLEKTAGGVWPGNVYRIDVWTKDTRPTILCYGDSITFGYNSTPRAGKSYPELLSNLTGLPTLNLGVNGDVFTQTGQTPGIVKSLKGVDSVIVMMGINDIFRNTIKTPGEYSRIASGLIAGLKADGKKVYLGTILPASGNPQYDRKPEKEVLRQAVNTWIREKSKADGVIDFDAALRDPEKPSRFKEELQSDWVHPNDAGYQKMAETAAAFFKTPK